MTYTESDFQDWLKYECVRLSGKYNMILDYKDAMKECQLTPEKYKRIVQKYRYIKSAIVSKHGSVEEYMKKEGGCQ